VHDVRRSLQAVCLKTGALWKAGEIGLYEIKIRRSESNSKVDSAIDGF